MTTNSCQLGLKINDKDIVEDCEECMTDRQNSSTSKDVLPHHQSTTYNLCTASAWEIMAAEEVHSLNDSNEHWVCMYVQRTSTVDVYHSLSAKVSCEADNLYFILPPPSFTIWAINSQGQSGGSECGLCHSHGYIFVPMRQYLAYTVGFNSQEISPD